LDDERIKQRIEELVGRYNDLKRSKSSKELEALSEANVRADFIDPLFEILGWKVKDPDEYDREHYVRRVGLADVALKLDGAPVVFVEAKRFGGIPHIDDRGDADWTLEERQVILYAVSSNCRWAVLTNFEKFRVFNALTGLTILDFESIYDYTDRFGELLYLTRDYVDSGRIERLAERKERQDIDLDFLKMLNTWRIQLANDIYQRNKDNDVLKDEEKQLDLEKLKDAVQRTLDRLIIIRWAEDRLVLDDPNLLERKYHDWKLSPTYNSIFDSLFADRALFDKFNYWHDSKIFKRGGKHERGHICDQVEISDDVLGKIIHEMCQRSFRKFDFDILGNTYETYLGNTLYLKDDGTLGLKPSMETRKEAGIYYTPPYVVDYIIKNTLGELLKGKTPEDVAKIKVLDPACGSGSFLIKAFDYLNDYYGKENEKVRKRKEKLIKEYMKSSGNQLKLDIEALEHKEYKDIEKEILKNNIHGVDLDRQAAEIASVNLMLKALKPKEKLPLILDENIKVGNSLISGTEDELKQYFGDDWKEKRPFNWEEEFDGKFDVVIGNPPYFSIRETMRRNKRFREDYNYIQKSNQWKDFFRAASDIYYYFVIQSLKLLKNKGRFGFIIENYWLENDYADKLKEFMLNNAKIDMIIHFGKIKIFPEAGNDTCILIFQKERDKKLREGNKVKIVYCKNSFEAETLGESNRKLVDHIKKYISRDLYRDDYIDVFWAEQKRLDTSKWVLSPRQEILDRIEGAETTLGDLCKIGVGQNTGLDKVFTVDRKTIREHNLEDELLKPIIKNSHIKKYVIDDSGLFMIYTSNDTEIKKYPNIHNYLNQHKEDLKKRHRVRKGVRKWYAISVPQNEDIFDAKEKIVVPYRAKENTFAYDNCRFFNDGGDVRGIILKASCKLDIKYVLGLLNSKLLNYWYKEAGKRKGGMFEYFTTPLSRIPIVDINFSNASEKSIHDELVTLVDKMLVLNKERNKINTDFDHYVNLHPRTEDALLKHYVDKLPANDKEVLKDHLGKSMNRVDGKFKEFEILEEGEWLVFKVGYLLKTKKGEMPIRNVRAFRCRIADEKLRKFLYYSIKEYTRPGKLGKGNIYERLLKIKIPQFVPNAEKNKRIIDEIMTPFLEEVAKRDKLEKEIEETDKEIDQKVYELYGLTEEEIKVVESE